MYKGDQFQPAVQLSTKMIYNTFIQGAPSVMIKL